MILMAREGKREGLRARVVRRQEIEPLEDEIDPAVQELCDYFNIEAFGELVEML